MEKQLYALQRFLILQTKVNPETTHQIPDAYAYAWYEECYPLFHSGFHEGHKNQFKISERQVNILSLYADSEWLAKRYYTFYQYEDYFGVRSGNPDGIDRVALIRIFRYMFLNKAFDDKFWETLIKPMEHPSEAYGIITEFKVDDIYFV